MECFYWSEPHVTEKLNHVIFLSVSFYSLAEGSPAFKSRVLQPIKMRYNFVPHVLVT